MTVSNWIFFGIFVISLGIYIFSSIIKQRILQKIFGCTIFPCLAILNIQFLNAFLPDVKHVLFVSFGASFFSLLAEVFFVFEEKTWSKKLLQVSCFLLSFSWALLFRSVLYLVEVSHLFKVFFAILYFAILCVTLIFSPRKKFFQILSFSLVFAQSAILNFLSLVYLCYLPRLQSLLLFLGTFSFLFLICFYSISENREKIKFRNTLILISFLLSQILIMYSNILLIRL